MVVEYNRAFDVGDKLRIEKVLMVGGENFSVYGRPLLPKDFVSIQATVIEKTLSNTEPDYDYVPKKRIKLLTFIRKEINLVRINDIKILKPLAQTDVKE